jgi:hypothetical protein
VVRVVMFMKQTRNLHVFHMPDLLKPPVHRVVPLVGVRPSVQHSFLNYFYFFQYQEFWWINNPKNTNNTDNNTKILLIAGGHGSARGQGVGQRRGPAGTHQDCTHLSTHQT